LEISMRKFLPFALTMILATNSAAQSEASEAIFRAIGRTPVGALPPVLTMTLASQVQKQLQFAFRYGYLSESRGVGTAGDFAMPAQSDFGLTLVAPARLGVAVNVTGGATVPTCDGCSTQWMFGFGGDVRLWEFPFGATPDATRVTLSLNSEVGFGWPGESRTTSVAAGLPLALVTDGRPATAIRIVPFVTPGVAWARETRDSLTVQTKNSGSRFMLGGGVGVFRPKNAVTLNLGFQTVFVDNGETMVGLALTLGGR
jgi:hypothetical protein